MDLQDFTGTIHSDPRHPSTLNLSSALFATGIKVLDVLTPYTLGGKVGLFGGAGVGKTVLNDGRYQ